MYATVRIGTWHEKERKLVQHTSYAADYINHVSKPGDYAAVLLFDPKGSGFVIDMPQYVMIRLDTYVTDGEYFSGFGGVNFASRPVEPHDDHYVLQPYSYMIPDMVKNGNLTLFDEFQWLNADKREVINHIRNHPDALRVK